MPLSRSPTRETAATVETRGVETRSKTAAPKYTEKELDLLAHRNEEIQAKLLAENQALKREQEQFEREKVETRRAYEKRHASLEAKEKEILNWERDNDSRDETINRLMNEVREMQSIIRQTAATGAIPRNPLATTPPPRDPSRADYNNPTARPPREIHFTMDEQEDLNAPRISFREVLETIPTFNGYNMPVAQFARACRRARDLFPAQSERNLTKMICNKLRDRAAAAVEDEPCSSITQLIDLLNGAFGSLKTVDQYRGELSMIFLKPSEHVLDYISRVKDLRSAIIDSMRREGADSDDQIAEVDRFTVRSFCDGLPLPYRLQMQSEKYTHPADAFSAAKTIARRRELDNQRFERAPRIPPPRSHDRMYARDTPPPRASVISNVQARDRPQNYRPEPPARTFESPRDWTRNRTTPRDEPNNARLMYNAPTYTPPRRDEKWCRYCKIGGHEIDECRKRQFNNNNRQGNGQSPSRNPGEPREVYPRPQRQINIITENTKPVSSGPENPEPSTSQCSISRNIPAHQSSCSVPTP